MTIALTLAAETLASRSAYFWGLFQAGSDHGNGERRPVRGRPSPHFHVYFHTPPFTHLARREQERTGGGEIWI